MTADTQRAAPPPFSRLEAARAEQTPQALARLVVIGLFILLWIVLWIARIPMPAPFLFVLALESLFFIAYWRVAFVLPSVPAVRRAQYVMLAAEIVFHTTIVYFLGSMSWMGSMAYVFGLIFSNAFLDLRRGLIYTAGASSALIALLLLEATGVVPHYVYLDQGPLRYQDPRFVATTVVGTAGVFFSIYLWSSWVGYALRRERDAAVTAQDRMIEARAALQRANFDLEQRVRERTIALERVNTTLREQQARLRTVVDNTPIILFALDREGLFTLAEGKGLEPLGLQSDRIIGQSILEAYADQPQVLEAVRGALAGRTTTASAEINGVIFESHMSPLLDAGGAVSGVIGVAIDVTQRNRAEDARRESEELLRATVESTADGILVVNNDGKVAHANARFVSMWRIPPNLLAGRDDDALLAYVLDQLLEPELFLAKVRELYASDSESLDRLVFKDGRIFERFSRPLLEDGAVAGRVWSFRDISEQQRAEQALRESETKFRTLAENIGAATFILREGRFVYANAAAERLTGYARTDLYARAPRDLIHPEYKGQHEERARARRRGETVPNQGETVILREDGTRRWVQFTTAEIQFEGRPATLGTAFDITERKVAEDALRDSETKFRTMAETISAAAFIFQGTKMRYVNSAAEAITGYTRDELLQMDFWSVIHPDFQDLVKQRGLARQRGNAVPSGYEVKIMRKDSSERWVQFTAGQITYEGGPAVLGTAFDITERKRAEEALRVSEERFRKIFEEGPLGMALVSPELKTERANASLCRMLGYSEDELHALTLTDITHPDDLAADLEQAARLFEGEISHYQIDKRYVRKDGSIMWGTLTATAVRDNEGRFLYGIGMVEDITERKHAEDRLRDAAMRDPLTGVLNHAAVVDELRTIVRVGGTDRCAVAMVDVDGLKAINDTHGHPIGDAVLLTIARSLDRAGAIIGRYGGDEFIAILPRADRAAAGRYRKAVLGALAKTRISDPETGGRVPVVASIGLAVYPEEAATVHELIGLADSAMYTSRRQRPIIAGDVTLASRAFGGDREAQMVGEIVPLLTSEGSLDDKLRVVSHRLSVGAGYDAVNFSLYAPTQGPPIAQHTVADAAADLVEQWDRDQRSGTGGIHPVRNVLEQTKRPLIIDKPWDDPLLLDNERELLRAAGLQSVLVAPMIWQDKLLGSLGVASKRADAFSSRDAQFITTVATQLTAILRMATLVDELQASSTRLQEAQTETVFLLAAAAEAHDQTTGRHLRRVRSITEALARELGHDEDEARELGLAAVLHDIGKIRVPDTVLAHAGKLRETDWDTMRQHTVWGAQFLAGRKGFELASSIARSHHERWDGGGYPDGLIGDAIPEVATIVAVADSFDAIVSDRPYRAGRSVRQALKEIEACSGTQFSPRVVQALLRLHKRRELPVTARQPRQAA